MKDGKAVDGQAQGGEELSNAYTFYSLKEHVVEAPAELFEPIGNEKAAQTPCEFHRFAGSAAP